MINLIDTTSSSFSGQDNLIVHGVAHLHDTDKVVYNTADIKDDLVTRKTAQAGDIVLANKVTGAKRYISKDATISDYTDDWDPIAIVVSPYNQFGDYKVRCCALAQLDLDNQETGNKTKGSLITLGPFYVRNRITYATGYISGNSDISQLRLAYNGKGDTWSMMADCLQYTPYTGTVANTPGNAYCPGVFLATKYRTTGTKAGDWYIPAAGEFQCITDNMTDVLASVVKCGGPTDFFSPNGFKTTTPVNNNQNVTYNFGTTPWIVGINENNQILPFIEL